ncbi:MAG: LysR family transcriptional regulator [Actinomycetaceae bacterium]
MVERPCPDALRYVRAVGEAGSFTAAARAAGVTRPALSNPVARLEDQLGEQLFHRSTRGVLPTAFGEHLLPFVDWVLRALDSVGTEAERWRDGSAVNLRVGVVPLISAEIVARTCAAVCGADTVPAGRPARGAHVAPARRPHGR